MSDNGGLGIIGIGNVLMGDDAIGPSVIALLDSRWEWPEMVALLDAGAPGPELATLLESYEAVIVVDAVDAEYPPGTLVRLERPAILEGLTTKVRTPHDPGLTAALSHLDLLGQGPSSVCLLGMVPDRANMAPGLSDVARSTLPRLLEMVLEEVAAFCDPPKKRETPLPENLWWERR